MDRDHIRLLILGAVVALAVATVVFMVRGDRAHELVLNVEPIDQASEITVYAGGAVATPGLYTLPLHARVATLLEKAGLLASADGSTIQMGAELRDGQQVIVPLKKATAAAIGSPPAASSSTGTPSPTITATALIDINSANVDQLQQLPGIGPALAQRIVDYRNEHGPFASLDDLAKVKGISDRMVDDVRLLATVGSS